MNLASRLAAALEEPTPDPEVMSQAMTAFGQEALSQGLSLAEVVTAYQAGRGLAPTVPSGADPLLQALLEPYETERRGRRELAFRLMEIHDGQRLRLAGEIHDDTIQLMAATYMRLQMLRRRLTAPADQDACADLESNVRRSVESLRRLIFELRPSALEEEGLAAAVAVQLEHAEESADLKFRLQDRISDEPSGRLRLTLYRLTQEVLGAIRRSGRTKKVDVALTQDSSGYAIRVSFDDAGRDGSVDLGAPSELAAAVGGWCQVETLPGAKTTVTIHMPAESD